MVSRHDNHAKELIKEILYNSLAQALIKLLQTPHKILKVILFVFVMLTSSMCSYLILESVASFLNYDVVTVSRTVLETPTPFPKISICNLNQFTTKYAFDYLNEIDKMNSTKSFFTFDQNLNSTERKVLAEEIHNIALVSRSIHVKKKFSHTLDEILFSCYFNGQKCSSQDFVWEWDPQYGNCYVFNSDFNLTETRKTFFIGYYYGLKMSFYVGFYQELTNFNSYTSGGLGAVIKIENNTFRRYNSENLHLSTGNEYFLAVERAFKFNLPKPYSNCEIDNTFTATTNNELINLIKNSPYEYTQQMCFAQCFQKQIIKRCGCYDLYTISLFKNANSCDKNSTQCIQKIYDDLDGKLKNKCLEFCPLECNKTEFKFTLSSFKLLGEYYASQVRENSKLALDFVNRSINSETGRESVINLNIYYDSLSYLISTEVPKLNIVEFLANVGGTLSLFLGISVFSLCEIVVLMIELFYLQTRKS